jgi:hypothetical protein
VGTIFGDIGASYSNNTSTERATGHTTSRGLGVRLPLPLFDWGGAAAQAPAPPCSAMPPSCATPRYAPQRGPQQLAGLPHGL